MSTHTEYILVPKIRCLTCEGYPTIVPDENQSPEEAGLQHLIAHKDDEGGPHELGTRYVLGTTEIDDGDLMAREGGEEAPSE